MVDHLEEDDMYLSRLAAGTAPVDGLGELLATWSEDVDAVPMPPPITITVAPGRCA